MPLYNIHIQTVSGAEIVYQSEVSANAYQFLTDFQDYLRTRKHTSERYDFFQNGVMSRIALDFGSVFSVSVTGVGKQRLATSPQRGATGLDAGSSGQAMLSQLLE